MQLVQELKFIVKNNDSHQVYISIGSNINREKNIQSIIQFLDKLFENLRLSPVYETAAEGFKGKPFYNLAASFSTSHSIEELTLIFKNLEKEHGRTKQEHKFSDRTLDIDILLYDSLILHNQGIDIPRHEILKFAFVLKPLVDIAPDLNHPQTSRTMKQHWQEFDNKVKLKKIKL